jgi:hypothetical protein
VSQIGVDVDVVVVVVVVVDLGGDGDVEVDATFDAATLVPWKRDRSQNRRRVSPARSIACATRRR